MAICMVFAATSALYCASWNQLEPEIFIDKASMSRDGDVVSVYTKEVFTEESSKRAMLDMKLVAKPALMITRLIVHCKSRQLQIPTHRIFDDNNNIIKSYDSDGGKLLNIYPESIGETVYNAVCKSHKQ